MLALRRAVLGLCWALPALALGAVRQKQPYEDKHFMANTYGFLRSSSDSVGEAAKSTLQVQSSLDELRKDLSSEYAKWMEKKKQFAAENERLRSSIARLQQERDAQSSLREKKLRLEGELGAQRTSTTRALNDGQRVRTATAEVNRTLQDQIATLRRGIMEAQQNKTKQDATIADASTATKGDNRKLQAVVLALHRQIQDLDAEAKSHQGEELEKQRALSDQLDAVQAKLSIFQKQMVEQAKNKHEVEAYKQRVINQDEQLLVTRKSTQSLRDQCMASQQAAEGQVAAAKHSLMQSNAAMKQCQEKEAQNQLLMGSLNKCLATKRSTR